MIFVLLFAYTLGCVQVLLMSLRGTVRFGVVAAALAIVANVPAVVFGMSLRAFLSVPIALVSGVAAMRALKFADELPRDTDAERTASRAGMALVGLAVCEILIVLVAAFVRMAA
jgi:hypothetical protein